MRDPKHQITVCSKKKDWQAGAELRGDVGQIVANPVFARRAPLVTMRVVPTTSYARGSKEPMFGKVGGASHLFAWHPTVGWVAWT